MPIYNIETTFELAEPLADDLRADLLATYDAWSNPIDPDDMTVTVTDREIIADCRLDAALAATELLSSIVPGGTRIVDQRIEAVA